MKNEYGEIVEILYNERIKVERITSNSNVTGYMEENIDEFVYLLEGFAILQMPEGEVKLSKNEHIYIPKNTKHRVSYTSDDCKWLCIFLKEEQ